MSSKRVQAANPFYVLLVIVSVIFLITVCMYGVMVFQFNSAAAVASRVDHPLIQFVRRYGDLALGTELALLGGLTLAAMGTDRFWTRRAQINEGKRHDESAASHGH